MTTIKMLLPLPLLFTMAAAAADTVIEFKYNNTQSQFLTNGSKARINARGTDDYMVVDFDTRTIYSVTPDKKQIANITESIPSMIPIEPPRVRTDIKPAGEGPVIAGFSTQKFRLSANGEYCGMVFASKDALKGTTIENMFGTLKTMSDSHIKSLGAFAAIIPSCQMAMLRLTDKLPYIGAPMRVIDVEGKVDSEITRIIKNAGVESHNYTLPGNFKMASTGELLEQMLSTIQRTGSTQQQPRPAQQSNRRPPGATERVRYWPR